MKTIVLTGDEDHFSKFTNCFSDNLVGLNISYVDTNEKLIMKLQGQSEVDFVMLDASLPKEKLKESLSSVIDIAGQRSILICGEKEDLASIDKSLLIKSENNYLFDGTNSQEEIKNIINTIKRKLRDKEEAAVAEEGLDFVPIKIRNLYFSDSMPFNLYVKISDKKYVLALEKNTDIAHSQIAKFIKRKINFLYIEKNAHLNFLEISMLKASKFFESNYTINKKLILAHLRSTALIQDYLYNVGITSTVELFMESLLENMIKSLDRSAFIQNVLPHFSFNFESNVGKSVLCSYISFFIIQDQGWKSDSIRKKFLLTSLIQDTFLDNDDLSKLKSLNDPNIINFTEDEIKNYSEHPEKIANLALQFTRFPDLEFILRQHHERANRDGFPNRPSPSEMQLAVCVFNFCSQFALELNHTQINDKNILNIYKKFHKDHNIGNFRQPIASAKKVFKLT